MLILLKKFRRKCIFNPYILHFFHFSPYILFLPLLVSKPINAWHLGHFRHSTNCKSWRGKQRHSKCWRVLRGKFLMFPNRIWGKQDETQRWALEIKPKGYQCGVSPPKQEIEAAL